MSKGIILTVSAPSGTGKSTLINLLTREYPEFGFSISYTTRSPRPGEVHGREYYFVNEKEFTELIDRNFFAEWARVHGNYYGTPLQKVLDAVSSGKSLIFDIDVQGAAQLKKNLNMGLFVFIFPPSIKALEERLTKRGTDDSQTISKRLASAQSEISKCQLFDFWIVNHELDTAFNQLKAIVTAEKLRPAHNPDLPELVTQGQFSPYSSSSSNG